MVAGVTTRADGIPIDVDVCDGNMDDPTWSREALLSQGRSLAADIRAQTLFVADSKLVSHNTVADLCDYGIHFVSRVPNTFGLERDVKAAARAAAQWTVIGRLATRDDAATYRVWETTGQIGARDVRLLVVHSSALEAKALHKEEARVTDDAAWVDHAVQQWEQRRFACRADAQAAWDTWCATKRVRQAAWLVTGEVVESSAADGDPAWTVVVTRGAQATERHRGLTVPAQHVHSGLE